MDEILKGFRFKVVLPDAPSLTTLPHLEPITFKRGTSSNDSDFWTWVQTFMGQSFDFTSLYTPADEPNDPKQKRTARMEALSRMAAPGSGATDPERTTAQRILDRMREEKDD